MSLAAPDWPGVDAGPLGHLPRLSPRQVRLEERLARIRPDRGFSAVLSWLEEWLGPGLEPDRIEVLWRGSGLVRAGLVGQLAWPRLGTRLAIGIETPLAHAIVDRLLGFERLAGEGRLQLSPVEWGILTFVVAKTLGRLGQGSGLLGSWDLILDRVGPDPFDPSGLGTIVTLRWPVRLGAVEGSVRLWLPESLVAQWLTTEPSPPPQTEAALVPRFGDLDGVWRAVAGKVELPRGIGSLRAGGVLTLSASDLHGTPKDLKGAVELTLTLTNQSGRYWYPVEPAPLSGGGRVTLAGPLQREFSPREAIPVNPAPDPTQAAGTSGLSPTDVPVTLIVELGRVNFPLRRLADLKAGDVVELFRHSREPVELTSGGRLVARGELVLLDTELGVRVTSVFL